MKNPKLIRARMGASFVCDITLLDLFAGMALQGLIASWHITGKGDFPEDNPGKIAEDSFAMAHAMLEEREKHFLQMKVKGETHA